jgi:two-component system, chemotaxis family, CheB/CheR fusion protein
VTSPRGRKTSQAAAPKKARKRSLKPAAMRVPQKAAKPEPGRVVGIGASAGGLDAFSRLLEELPRDTRMAFVLVQHLAPGYESALPVLLQKSTSMRVVQVADGILLQPDTVHVVPPNAEMQVVDGRLHLLPRPTGPSQYTPINFFFHSLAQQAAERAIGVILAGTGTDGAEGLKEIKAAGGLTLVQNPSTAAYPGMPQAAIATECVDFVLSPAEIGRKLALLARAPAGATDNPEDGEHPFPDAQMDRVFELLRERQGVDFSLYKQPTIRRRIQRRMTIHRLGSLGHYLSLLEQSPAEVERLYQDVLIQVTSFFREPESTEALARDIFPRLLQQRQRDAPVRVWVPGCATGEEVYSVAILLLEAMGGRPTVPVQIFGTDISDTAIDFARAGVYPRAIQEHVSPERLRQFFVRTPSGWQIHKSVRDLCIFARQDLTRDPPFSRLDLIVCRNVLIYLGPVLQKKLMGMFHYALRPSGCLMLGRAETTGTQTGLFSVVDKKNRIFMKRLREGEPVASVPPVLQAHRTLPGQIARGHPRQTGASSIQAQAGQIVLERFAPPGVLVDASHQIVQFRGQTGPYLEPASGQASLNVLKMAREGLLHALRSALQEARRKARPVRREGLQVRSNGGSRPLRLDVVPVGDKEHDRHYLILFQETPDGQPPESAATPRKGAQTSRGGARERHDTSRLQRELAASKDYLQSIIQDLEAANEELQSANEEILSSNEELQSTNEELDTAKEELQSINEELSTVNEELHARNEELSRVNSDLLNILGSVHMAIVLVGNDLRIRRFTPMAEKLLNLIPADVGRPVGNIHPSFDAPSLGERISRVMETLAISSEELQDREGRWFSMTVRPYRSIGNTIDGAVITIHDITEAREQRQRSELARSYPQAIFETVKEPLLILDDDLKVVHANGAFYRTFRTEQRETLGSRVDRLADGSWNIGGLTAFLEEIAGGRKDAGQIDVELEVAGRGRRPLSASARRVVDVEGRRVILLALGWGEP